MIRRYEQSGAGPLGRLQYARQARVDCLDCLDRRRNRAAVTDHVRISVVAKNEIVLARRYSLDERIRYTGRTHFGLKIVSRDLRARHHDSVLARKRSFDATVEEVSHMRVLL